MIATSPAPAPHPTQGRGFGGMRNRCAVVSSQPTDPGQGYCHAHELRLECGQTRVSRAEVPPVTVAACRRCSHVPDRPKRPELEF